MTIRWLEASVAGRPIGCGPRQALALSYPPRPADPIHSQEGCGRINVTITGEAMRQHLMALLGRPPAYGSTRA